MVYPSVERRTRGARSQVHFNSAVTRKLLRRGCSDCVPPNEGGRDTAARDCRERSRQPTAATRRQPSPHVFCWSCRVPSPLRRYRTIRWQ